jgi:hypothetical protein
MAGLRPRPRLFTHWESDEYRSVEIHNLTKGGEK